VLGLKLEALDERKSTTKSNEKLSSLPYRYAHYGQIEISEGVDDEPPETQNPVWAREI
jgi:hypothetical protein